MFAAAMACSTFVYMIGVPAILAGLLFRGGLVMLMFQLVAVNRSGKRSNRAQMFWRAILWTIPAIAFGIGFGMLAVGKGFKQFDATEVSWAGFAIVMVTAFITFGSMILLKRGLLDRLSGTYIVPR